jgi:hypothetical protein
MGRKEGRKEGKRGEGNGSKEGEEKGNEPRGTQHGSNCSETTPTFACSMNFDLQQYSGGKKCPFERSRMCVHASVQERKGETRRLKRDSQSVTLHPSCAP